MYGIVGDGYGVCGIVMGWEGRVRVCLVDVVFGGRGEVWGWEYL